MTVPILRQGEFLVASIQAALTDRDLVDLRDRLVGRIGEERISGVVVDVSALDVLDSFAARTLRTMVHSARLRGADAVIVGIQPDVAFAMVQLGLTLDGVETALDLDEALAWLGARRRSARRAD